MRSIRQGDVILQFVHQNIEGEKLPHLVLAEGEVTGHKHCITKGQAELYQQKFDEDDSILYLRVLSEKAILTHEEHQAIEIPKGNWKIRIQREYEPEGWKYVAD